ncbi:hypothetical protein O3G_MSEX015482 [Manduca sexta]|uniref:Uncharacterized protein n=1 Tax=Manduca sexta TaxID=7130 RepID=A0A921ZXC0_MANSE|nr:hypothetical protein O3G_MSEX015482 [Manduca sexta]
MMWIVGIIYESFLIFMPALLAELIENEVAASKSVLALQLNGIKDKELRRHIYNALHLMSVRPLKLFIW